MNYPLSNVARLCLALTFLSWTEVELTLIFISCDNGKNPNFSRNLFMGWTKCQCFLSWWHPVWLLLMAHSLIPKHYIHTYYNISLRVEFGKFASLGSRDRKGLHLLMVAFKCIYKHFTGGSWAWRFTGKLPVRYMVHFHAPKLMLRCVRNSPKIQSELLMHRDHRIGRHTIILRC